MARNDVRIGLVSVLLWVSIGCSQPSVGSYRKFLDNEIAEARKSVPNLVVESPVELEVEKGPPSEKTYLGTCMANARLTCNRTDGNLDMTLRLVLTHEYDGQGWRRKLIVTNINRATATVDRSRGQGLTEFAEKITGLAYQHLGYADIAGMCTYW